jgi:hypothetical protein
MRLLLAYRFVRSERKDVIRQFTALASDDYSPWSEQIPVSIQQDGNTTRIVLFAPEYIDRTYFTDAVTDVLTAANWV